MKCAEKTTSGKVEQKFVSEMDAAKFAGLSNRTLQKWRLFGQGPRWFKVGGSVRYDLSEFESWIREHSGGGEAA